MPGEEITPAPKAPIFIEVCLKLYYRAKVEDREIRNTSPAHAEVLEDLIQQGLVETLMKEVTGPMLIVPTDGLERYVKKLCEVQPPAKVWSY